MAGLVSEEVALHWIKSKHLLPTRSLQLSFDTANIKFDQLNDFSVVLGILRNNPSIVPPDLIETIQAMSVLTRSAEFRTRIKKQKTARSRYAGTILPIEFMLNQYLFERQSQGIHQYSLGEDYSTHLVAKWAELSGKQSTETEFEILGAGDYLRILARTIDRYSNAELEKSKGIYRPSIGNILRWSRFLGGMNKKKLVKILKGLSREIAPNGGRIHEHQEIIMMLSNNRLRVRPISLIAEASWEISHKKETYGCVSNLLSESSPVHDNEGIILEFEDMLNSKTAAEHDFQIFFETNPSFLLGTDYSKLISHPILIREDEDNLIPDFVLIPYEFASPRIVDLKLPNVNIARHVHSREGFLQKVLTARDQLLEYKNYFSGKSTSEDFRVKYGCEMYLPKIAVIIGRSSSFLSEYERRKIESRVPDIEVITYDDLLERARGCRNISFL